MFESKQVVVTVFRFINFAIIVFLIQYLFKKIGVPDIKEKLAAKLNFFKNLRNKFKDLIEENSLVEKEIKDQDKLFDALKIKIQTWNTQRQKQEEDLKNQLEKIKADHTKRIEKQTEQIYQQKLIRKVLPQVIDGTYKQLEQKFSKEHEAKKFLKDIISYMKKSTNE